LEKRNKTGYCTSHRGNWKKQCDSCSSLIYAGSKTGLCNVCYNKAYYKKNKDRLNSHYNAIYHNNKKEINKRRAKRETWRWHNDSEFRLKKTIRSRFKKAVKESWRSGSFIKSLGCSISELKIYLESKFQKGMSWENYGTYWEIDHIQPFCSADLSNWKEVQSIIHYSNLQPICKKDHIQKTNEDRKNVTSKI
jgi:hypothetical protein